MENKRKYEKNRKKKNKLGKNSKRELIECGKKTLNLK